MQKVFIFFVFAMMAVGAWSQYGPNNTTIGERPVIFNGTGYPHKLIEVQPEGWYYYDTRMLTIEFPSTGFVPYTLSISSELNTLDYYVTTPLTSVYISPEVVQVDVQLATDGGDMYYGSFEASSNTSTE